MKTLVQLLMAASLWLAGPASAQPLTATPGSTGVYLFFGKELPKTFSYQLDRSPAGQNRWETLTTTAFPKVPEEFTGRLSEAVAQLPPSYVRVPDRKLAVARYALLARTSTIDSLQSIGQLPHYQIAAGVGFWDAKAMPNVAYDYRLTRTTGGSGGNLTLTRAVRFPGSYPATTLVTDTAFATGPTASLRYRVASGRPPEVLDLYRAPYLKGEYKRIPASYHPVSSANGQMTYRVTDATVTDKLIYAYYAVPGDLFGNRGQPSDVRNLYNARQNEVVFGVYNFRVMSRSPENALRLSWRLPVSPEITSVDIYRSRTFDKTFARITSVGAKDTVYLDRNVEPVTTYFYTIVVNTAYGKAFPSARVPALLEANQPNHAPIGRLIGEQQGRVVKLTWLRPDPSIYGYQLYRTNRFADTQPEQVGSIIVTADSIVTVTDTLPVREADTWFYSVLSINTSYNRSIRSERVLFSGTVTVLPSPDLTVRLHNNTVAHLIWPNPVQGGRRSNGALVFRRELRADGTRTDWQQLTRQPLGPETNFYADTTVQPGGQYTYAVRNVGVQPGQLSTSSPEAGCTVPQRYPAAVRTIRALQSGVSVVLQWDKPFDPTVDHYVIYRAEAGQAFQRLKEVERTAAEFSDTTPLEKRTYYYRIVSEDRRKQQSRNPDTVGIYVE